MGQFFASKPGRATVVIPSAWLRRYQAEGFAMRPAPADLPTVDAPTSVAEMEQMQAARAAQIAAVSAPAPELVEEPEAPAPARRKRGSS